MSKLEILKSKLNAKENELSKNLQTFILNSNITNLMTEIQELKKEISNLEDIENEQSN